MKVIKDRDDRPKGFGYVEFGSVDDLKSALEKSGTVRSIRHLCGYIVLRFWYGRGISAICFKGFSALNSDALASRMAEKYASKAYQLGLTHL